MLIAGNYHSQRGGDLRRCSTTQHPLYCSIDRHARTIDGCLLPQDGESLVHRNMPAGPEPCLKAVAPSRSDLGVCVACLLPWDWRADLCARDGRPVGRGPALSRQALHGGTAHHDPLDAPHRAGLLRGGMRPQAYGSPAARRAPRALRRRRPSPAATRCAVDAWPANPPPRPLARERHTKRRHDQPAWGRRAVCRARRPHKRRGGPRPPRR